MGRPSLKTHEVIETICAALAEGTPLTVICRAENMPSPRTVRDWEADDPEVAAAIARAREIGEYAIAEGCLEIADDSRNDWMEAVAEGGDEKAARFNGDHVQRCKLRIETRLKLLAKFNPKKWGERQVLAGDPEAPLAGLSDEALDAKLAALMEKHGNG